MTTIATKDLKALMPLINAARVNARHLAELLALDQGSVRITFENAARPAVFEGQDATLTRVLMPMRD